MRRPLPFYPLNLLCVAAASAQSTRSSTVLNGLDSEAYLREVIGRIADRPINRIAELLPWNIGLASPIPVAA